MTADASTQKRTQSPALKEIFDANRLRSIAGETAAIHPGFDAARFLTLALSGLETLTLMQRLRRTTESLHATLPDEYRTALEILRRLAPRLNHSFASLILPDYVGLYGLDDFHTSMDALRFFTTFGSSEFAVRHFLRRDLSRTLAVMTTWSRDENEHVRRLASEGARPRLPWSFRLEPLIIDPSPVAPIIENLKADPSLYVRKSVANHLNDITKDHPAWVLDRIAGWILDNPHTAWIAKRALRTLIKQGDRQALAVLGADAKPDVIVHGVTVSPETIRLGDRITLSFRLTSTSATAQRLVVDYIVHYVKKSGATTAKVFKLRELTLGPGESVVLTRSQEMRDFTTRVHYPGRHEVEIVVNGERLAKTFFDLSR
ncbi:MAG: DNA alkylation repair enzyme [uncultured Thermomicrobiales bacterium]|uniref:DNA alkylation repair enzyme n=1 Tax=uncultured Thermomicrobiales bacterium TaxID=1645740 RepID=A0A6J4UIU6_9BACT|nr:MAG: DNA alkylation repair enzyme [uncultured Thermomicrobiales bacterium]